MDDFGSDSIANEIKRFNDTIMLLSKKIEDTTGENIKDYKIFDNLGGKEEGNFVEYLNRQMDITSTVEGFQLFERLYYELTGVPNLSDDKFNVKSGIAILYALVPFENLVSKFEIYFSRGLLHRLELINNIMVTLNKTPVKATLKWERNLPLDLQHIVDIVAKAKETGLLSDETLLKMFPEKVVTDVAEELEAVAEQKKKAIEEFGNLQNAGVNDEPEEEEEEEEDE
jgi:SPP1 family phage portal protein